MDGAEVGSSGRPPIGSMDWGAGEYEITAQQLLPVAEAAVQTAAVGPGLRVLDLGCGTGNAALLAAELGGRVTGVDPALRLLDVARSAAASRGLDIQFLPGGAASVPLVDASVDVVLSVFGVIFAPDAGAAADEMARVLVPGGRIVLSAWIPTGAISEMTGVAAEKVRQALGAPPGPKPFPWHDLHALSTVLTPHGFNVTLDERHLAFTAPSAREFLDQFQRHPFAVAGRAVLEPRGEADALRKHMLEILEKGNEDEEGFRVTSRYVIAKALRNG